MISTEEGMNHGHRRRSSTAADKRTDKVVERVWQQQQKSVKYERTGEAWGSN